ncbi:MAG: lipopolysaccharide heptosyltransferase II [Thermodesulfobacteriota bacterium]
MPFFFHNLFDRLQGLDEAPGPGLPLKAAAAFLAGIYGLGARTHRALYAQGWLKVKRLPAAVISVGNLTVGGTGKTPMAALLARLLQEQGQKVAILSRGYGGRAKNVTRVSDGKQIYEKPPDAGEEAFWLARTLPGAAVYTAPSRYAAGMAACRELQPDMFVLDDGFQHFQLHRDLDVVLLDAESPFGNGCLLPRGPLREPVAALSAADVLILTRFLAGRHQDRLEFVKEKYPGQIVLTAAILPTKARLFPEGREITLEGLKNRRLLAFAGLARPRVFSDTLRDLGVDLPGSQDFPDHYAFQADDLDALVKKAASLEVQGLITTAKDWARLGEKWPYPLPLYVLDVEARLEEGGEEKILEELAKRAGRGHSAEVHANKSLLQKSHGNFSDFSEKNFLSPPFLKGDLGGLLGAYNNPPYPPLEKGGVNTSVNTTFLYSSRAAQKDQSQSLQPLPPEVRQRFQELGVRGKWAGDPMAVRRILVRAPNWVGDAVMSLPALSGLQSLFPLAAITVLAAPRVAPLFAGIPGVAEVVVYPSGPKKWLTLWRLRRGITTNRKQKTENRKPRFDLGLALPNSWEAALGLWLAGAKIRVGYDTQGRGPLLNVAVTGAQVLSGLHTVYYLLGVLQGCGGVEAFTPPRLYLQEEEVQAAAAILKSDNTQGPWVGLSPGAAYGPAKRWPPERFAAVGRELQKEFNARLVLLGGPEDRDAAAEVKARLPEALDLVGRTSLRQALGVLKHLQLLITNDSGLMHAAAALGVPLLAIFGSTDPVATGPFTTRATVLHHPLPCSPCFKRTCDLDYQCLLDISVEEVTDAARVWLQEGL